MDQFFGSNPGMGDGPSVDDNGGGPDEGDAK